MLPIYSIPHSEGEHYPEQHISGQIIYFTTSSIDLLWKANKQTNSMKQSPSWDGNSYWRNSPHFMEPKGSYQHSQGPANCPYPELDQSSSCPQSHFSKIHLIPINFPIGLFPSDLPTKTPYVPLLSTLRATWPAQVILLDLITRITFGEEYRSWISSSCSCLHSSITSSL